MKRARDDAELMAIRAFEWLASDRDLLGRFLNVTGAGLDEIRGSLDDEHFLAAVLDFLMTDDRYVRSFCDHLGLDYTAVAELRASLPGGDLPHWT